MLPLGDGGPTLVGALDRRTTKARAAYTPTHHYQGLANRGVKGEGSIPLKCGRGPCPQ
jgi:hypothetical protein